MCYRLVCALLLSLGSIYAHACTVAQSAYISEEGLRKSHYRAPLPECVSGGQRITADELANMIAHGPLGLVDVQAIVIREETADFGYVWLPSQEREHIPGSMWLPSVGRWDRPQWLEKFFQAGLAKISAEDPNFPLVFYCVADCWMSWNAVQYAHKLGYQNIFWFAEGSDGWLASGRPLALAEPVAVEALIDLDTID